MLDRTALSSKAKPFRSRIDDPCVQSAAALWLGSAAMYTLYTSAEHLSRRIIDDFRSRRGAKSQPLVARKRRKTRTL